MALSPAHAGNEYSSMPQSIRAEMDAECCHGLNDMPTELLEEILFLLPTTALAKMRRVNRNFKATIDARIDFHSSRRKEHERLRIEQSMTRPVYTGLSIFAALRMYLAWNGGMPSDQQYHFHGMGLAADYIEDNLIASADDDDDVASEIRKCKRYYGGVIDFLLCLNQLLGLSPQERSRGSIMGRASWTDEQRYAHMLWDRDAAVDLMAQVPKALRMDTPNPFEFPAQAWTNLLRDLKRSPLDTISMTDDHKIGLEDTFWAAVDCELKIRPRIHRSWLQMKQHGELPSRSRYVDARRGFKLQHHVLRYQWKHIGESTFDASQMHKRRKFVMRLGLPQPGAGFQYAPSKRATQLAKWRMKLDDIGDVPKDGPGLKLLEVALCEEMRVLPGMYRILSSKGVR